MRFEHTSQTARLELRILELEDTVCALASITANIVEMTGKLNEIAEHYTNTLLGLIQNMPSEALTRAQNLLPLPPYATAGDCGAGHQSAPNMPPSCGCNSPCCGAKDTPRCDED